MLFFFKAKKQTLFFFVDRKVMIKFWEHSRFPSPATTIKFIKNVHEIRRLTPLLIL